MRKIKALVILHGSHYFIYLFSVSGIIMLLFSWLVGQGNLDGSFIMTLIFIVTMLLTKFFANETFSANSNYFAREMKYSGISAFLQVMFYSVVSFLAILFTSTIGAIVLSFYDTWYSMMDNVYFIGGLFALGNYMMSFLYILSVTTKRFISKFIKFLFMGMYVVLAVICLLFATEEMLVPLVLFTIVTIPTTYVLGYMIDKYDW